MREWLPGGLAEDLSVGRVHGIIWAGINGRSAAPDRDPQVPNGTVIMPSPCHAPGCRRGSWADLNRRSRSWTGITHGPAAVSHEASMAHMGVACVASRRGRPEDRLGGGDDDDAGIVPDYAKYPTGRDLKDTRGELGSADTGSAHAPPPLHPQGQRVVLAGSSSRVQRQLAPRSHRRPQQLTTPAGTGPPTRPEPRRRPRRHCATRQSVPIQLTRFAVFQRPDHADGARGHRQ